LPDGTNRLFGNPTSRPIKPALFRTVPSGDHDAASVGKIGPRQHKFETSGETLTCRPDERWIVDAVPRQPGAIKKPFPALLEGPARTFSIPPSTNAMTPPKMLGSNNRE